MGTGRLGRELRSHRSAVGRGTHAARALRPAVPILGLLGAYLLPTAVHAQARGSGHGVLSTNLAFEQRCGMCHAAHGGGAGAANLVTGPDLAFTRGVSAVSRSCLRCHATPDIRASDPALAASAHADASAPARSFLGDLADDHPLARVGGRTDVKRRSARWLRESVSGTRRRGALAADEEVLPPECTSCHAVHSGPDPILIEDGQRGICLECHEPARSLAGHVSLVCTKCHALHGGKDVALLQESSTDLLCRSCHDPAAPSPTNVAAPQLLLRRHVGSAERATVSCLSCHPVHR